MKSNRAAVAIGVASSMLGGVLFLPSARAECVMTADPCSTDSSADECCFAELGAVCDTGSNGGSCCFPIKDDPDALCTQSDDCCGTLLCIAGVCTDTIEYTYDGIDFTTVQTETEYGSGEYTFTSVTAQQEGSDPVLFELDADGEVVMASTNGDIIYPIPATSSRRLKTPWAASSKVFQVEPVAFSSRPQAPWENALTTVETGMERSTRHLNEVAVTICEIAAGLICGIAGGLACAALVAATAVTLGTVGAALCSALLGSVCGVGLVNIAEVCEKIIDCEGDPHMRGLQGQKFDFSGQDGGWYAILHDESFFVNMRVTAPIADLDEITYITGLGISTTDDSGDLHTMVLTVDNPLEMQSECPDTGGACLADGALTVELDGVTRTTPGEVSLGGGVFFSAANIPGECRPFGFEKYWQKKAAAQDSLVASGSRRLDVAPTSLWILSDDHKTNPVECRAYVRSGMEEGSLFDFQSEHTSIQIRADDLAIRVNHGKIHQLAMRNPTDQYNLPDHITFQMNIDFERFNIGDNPQGVIGVTAHIAKDEYGSDIMTGPDAIPGEEEDYRVSGPLGTEFVARAS